MTHEQLDIELVIFDLDGTLTRLDTFSLFILAYLKSAPSKWTSIPALGLAALASAAGFRDRTWLKSYFLRRLLANTEITELANFINSFCDHIRNNHLRDDVLQLASDARNSGARVVLITASPDLYVQQLVEGLPFDDVIATELEVNSRGVFTGRLKGANCKGEEKLTRLNQLLDGQLHQTRYAAYSDHHSDFPLLSSATSGVAVYPTRRLRRLARASGLAVFE